METNYQFKLKDKRSEKVTSIRLLFYKEGKRFLYGTGKSILPILWNEETQRPVKDSKILKAYSKEYPQLKIELENIGNRISKILRLTKEWFAKTELSNNEILFEELRNYLNNNLKIKSIVHRDEQEISIIYLDDTIRKFIRDISNGTKLIQNRNKKLRYRVGTIKVYISLLNSFKEYQDYTKKRYSIEDVTSNLSEGWANFLYKEKKASISNVGKYHKHFKTVVREKLKQIELENYELDKKNKPLVLSDRQLKRIEIGLESFKYIYSESTKVYLTQNEIESLELLSDLEPHLEVTRDVFLCGCYTALRYSDFSRISNEHIKSMGDKSWIEISTMKTGVKVKIPIKKELKTLLEKYNNVLPKTYEQKMNKYIKLICKRAGIVKPIECVENKGGFEVKKTKYKYELITTHTARRTGATLMHLDGHASKDIMSITGHKTLKSFETYLRIDKEESFKRMQKSKYFSNKSLTKIN